MFNVSFIFNNFDSGISKDCGNRLETVSPYQAEHDFHAQFYIFHKINVQLSSCHLARNTIPYNKHLMTGPKGGQRILFPENLNVSRDEVSGNIEIRRKQNSLFPKGPVIK